MRKGWSGQRSIFVLKWGDWERNSWGFSRIIFFLVEGEWPRLCIWRAVLGMERGSECPQSQAEFIQTRSVPYISIMSTALSGVHFEMG